MQIESELVIIKFNDKYDFSMWRVNMRELLMHQGLDDILEREGKLPDLVSRRNENPKPSS